MDTKILSHKEMELLKELIIKHKYNLSNDWKLIYRGSNDGFLATNFHSKCDNIPNTLCVIQSDTNNVFGGFTSIPWSSSRSSGWHRDDNAFLFLLRSLQGNKPNIFKATRGSTHVYHEPTFMCWFGWAILIGNKCNIERSSSVEDSSKYKIHSVGGKYFNSTPRFIVKEIQVFTTVT